MIRFPRFTDLIYKICRLKNVKKTIDPDTSGENRENATLIRQTMKNPEKRPRAERKNKEERLKLQKIIKYKRSMQTHGNFNFIETDLRDVFLIEPKFFGDQRGFFMEVYNEKAFKDFGLDLTFVQDNHSKSQKGVLRGLHFQKQYPQGKLIRVVSGKVLDVAVDLRRDSSSYGQWAKFEISAENKKMLWVPKGFAHGFLTLTDNVEFLYKCTDFYHPNDEGGIIWNDPDLNIDWNIGNPILSEKDQNWPRFKELNFSF